MSFFGDHDLIDKWEERAGVAEVSADKKGTPHSLDQQVLPSTTPTSYFG